MCCLEGDAYCWVYSVRVHKITWIKNKDEWISPKKKSLNFLFRLATKPVTNDKKWHISLKVICFITVFIMKVQNEKYKTRWHAVVKIWAKHDKESKVENSTAHDSVYRTVLNGVYHNKWYESLRNHTQYKERQYCQPVCLPHWPFNKPHFWQFSF